MAKRLNILASVSTMLFAAIVLYSAAIAAIIYYFDSVRFFILNFKKFKKIPGPPTPNAIVGNILHLHTSPENIYKKIREFGQKYYPIYNLRAFHLMAVNVFGPDEVEAILSNPKHNEKSIAYDLLHDWLGTGLLTSAGKKWMTRRRILTPAFHFSILQQFLTIFNEETENLVEILKEQCHEVIDVVPHVTQFTLKTIAETAMGTKLTFTTKKEMKYKEAVYRIGRIVVYRLLHSWLIFPIFRHLWLGYYKERKAVRTLHNFTKEVIRERQKNFENVEEPTEEHDVYVGKRRLAMLDLLLTAKNKEGIIDDDGIREEVDTFMFEGHDTTAVALGFALMLIANHKTVQDQIVDEINSVLIDPKKKPTYQDLQNMNYLERTLKEVLRLYPSVPFISRKLGEDIITKDGYILPKDSIASLHIYDLHHNPNIYPDPEKFDPDRFLPEISKNRHPYAFVPFSAGSRNCIGKRFAMLELKAAICGVLANFVLEPIDTPDSIVIVADLVLRTKNGIKIKFVPRP